MSGDNYKTFITDSLIAYDKNMKEQQKILKNATHLDIITFNNDIENDKIIFYDDKNKKIMEAEFELISNYDPEFNLWIWGWGDARSRKKWIRTISKILNYGISIESDKNLHLKLELVNSRFIISDPIQIEIHLAIASTLAKIPNVYQFAHSKIKTKNDTDSPTQTYKIIKDIDKNVDIFYFFLYNIKKYYNIIIHIRCK